jgi:hypothetical protein
MTTTTTTRHHRRRRRRGEKKETRETARVESSSSLSIETRRARLGQTKSSGVALTAFFALKKSRSFLF